ncbi:MAG: aminotransferase class IV [Trueperaceae bacterium]|nr:aminotransferase class IV [Trueperaceae bacterium]
MQPAAPEPFETLRWEAAAGGFVRLEAHLARLARSAGYLGVTFSASAARSALAAAATGLGGTARVRLLITASGAPVVTTAPLPPAADAVVPVGVAFELVDETDPLRRHKTTARGLYDEATSRAQALGLADIVFLNRRGTVAEGAISNVFVPRGDLLVTPPVDAGALPGVLRGELLGSGDCEVGELTLADLEAGEFYLGNSLRGLRRARLAPGMVVVGAER